MEMRYQTNRMFFVVIMTFIRNKPTKRENVILLEVSGGCNNTPQTNEIGNFIVTESSCTGHLASVCTWIYKVL